jgi:hypothetical protein
MSLRPRVPHRGPSGGKSRTGDRPVQVVLGIAVPAGKLRAAEPENIFDLGCGYAQRQQVPGDPEIDNTPVGLRKTLGDPPWAYAVAVDIGGLCHGHGGRRGIAWVRCAGSPVGRPQQIHGRLQQSVGVGRQARTGVDDLHPRSVATAGTPHRFLVRETGESAQMTPVSAGPIAAVITGQLPGYGSCNAGFQDRAAYVNPSLHMVWTGLEYNAGMVPVVTHPVEDIGVSAIEIEQNIAGVLVLRVGLNVDIASFTVANAQECDGCRIEQLSPCPQPFSRERSTSPIMDQTDQIQIVRHRCHLAADRLRRKHEPAINHADSMLWFDSKAKAFAANGNLSLISLSHIRGSVHG